MTLRTQVVSTTSDACARCGATDETDLGQPIEGKRYCRSGVKREGYTRPSCEMEAEWEIEAREERIREDEWQAMRDAPDIRKRKRNERLLSIHEANVAASTGQLGEIIALHAPRPDKRYPALVWCTGCPAHGYEAEPGVWPCCTYKIATRHLRRQR